MNTDDYALLALKKRIGQETGYFGVYALSDSHDNLLNQKESSIVGYARDQLKVGNEEKYLQFTIKKI